MLYGVFIGIDQYRDPQIPLLQCCAQDARRFQQIVSDRLAETDRQTWLFLNETATRTNIMHLIGSELAGRAQPDDMVLLYYSGHGSPEITNTVDTMARYLVPYDTDYDAIFATAIDLERDFLTLSRRIQSNWVLILLDACFSGKAGGKTFDGPWLARSPGRLSLKNLAVGAGRAILTACDEQEVALEAQRLGHSVFTFFLLQTLTNSRLGKTLGVGELYEQLSQKVSQYTQGRQHPILNGRLVGAKIPLFIQ